MFSNSKIELSINSNSRRINTAIESIFISWSLFAKASEKTSKLSWGWTPEEPWFDCWGSFYLYPEKDVFRSHLLSYRQTFRARCSRSAMHTHLCTLDLLKTVNTVRRIPFTEHHSLRDRTAFDERSRPASENAKNRPRSRQPAKWEQPVSSINPALRCLRKFNAQLISCLMDYRWARSTVRSVGNVYALQYRLSVPRNDGENG